MPTALQALWFVIWSVVVLVASTACLAVFDGLRAWRRDRGEARKLAYLARKHALDVALRNERLLGSFGVSKGRRSA